MRVTVLSLLLTFGGVVQMVQGGGREMPQAMVDEMMGGFFKMIDSQIAEIDAAVSESIKGTQGGFAGDIKTVMKDIKSDMALSSPTALASQWTEQFKVFCKQYSGRVVDTMGPLSDAQIKMLEGLEKLPIFKFKDRRAPDFRTQFRAKFEAEVAALIVKIRAATAEFHQYLSGFKDTMVAMLEKQGANDERAPKQIPGIKSDFEQSKAYGLSELDKKIAEWTPTFFSAYDKPPAAAPPPA